MECHNIKGSYLFIINLGWIYLKKEYNISRKKGEDFMKVNINNLVSISEANQNFSKVARLVDENGAAVILKNNVPRYAGWPPHKNEEESKEIIKMFIKNKDTYAIVLKSGNKIIGGIGLHDRQPDESLSNLNQREIGYVLNPEYLGRGIVLEAVNELIRYSFEELDLDLVWCGHYDFNLNSKRVNEKCGFKYRLTKKKG